ncbi:hypothetical protein Skr01_22730 [Sphaerisporangium krabiense]|nr:hypothetical protein Skr01_22730 [Sphaerisporangium krabiense]
MVMDASFGPQAPYFPPCESQTSGTGTVRRARAPRRTRAPPVPMAEVRELIYDEMPGLGSTTRCPASAIPRGCRAAVYTDIRVRWVMR